MNKPAIIGITADIEGSCHILNRVYVDAVVRCGAIPLVLPSCADYAAININVILDAIDGLLLSGGGDIHGSHFGQPLDSRASGVLPYRDKTELALAQSALERDMPILGICRGMQLLNVRRGGDLFQHIDRHKQNEPRNAATHQVLVSGALARLLGVDSIMTNTIHHQAVDNIGKNFDICARTTNGVVEAIWATDKKFVLGVQWHPEELVECDLNTAIFAAFVAAARA